MHNIGNVKTGNVTGTKFFDCMLQAEHYTKRAVCFSPTKRRALHEAQQSKSPVKIRRISASRGDICLSESLVINFVDKDEIPFKFDKKLGKDAFVTIKELQGLAIGQLVNIQAEVFSVSETLRHHGMHGAVEKQEVILRDSTNGIKLDLFGDDVGTLEVSKCYRLQNIRRL